MKYSLRSLMIIVILAPPILAAGWMLAGIAVQELRRRNQAEEIWEDVGGPGTIAEFSTNLHGDLVVDGHVPTDGDQKSAEQKP